MSEGTGQYRRCRHCRRVLREFCGGACRQREWVFRQRAAELNLSDEELIVVRTELDSLLDELYVLACAIEDAERDGALTKEASPQQVLYALRWIIDAAKPVIDPARLSPLRP